MNECDGRFSQLQRGAVIAYRLRPSDRPTNPQRLWHGRVEDVHAPICWVRLLDPGYAGLDEMIFHEYAHICCISGACVLYSHMVSPLAAHVRSFLLTSDCRSCTGHPSALRGEDRAYRSC